MAIYRAGRELSPSGFGKVVLFKGTADLGAKQGGVYDWIGRATDKKFVGFYTSAYYAGTFNLSRAK